MLSQSELRLRDVLKQEIARLKVPMDVDFKELATINDIVAYVTRLAAGALVVFSSPGRVPATGR